ncbi:DUF2806 domain-containing protein [Mucilaginibacter sp. SG564]|uniref:DUF2806 domain-containing protein n=1 Tax=Mucilaginibacter sp. SG564 TaxID=2587022 RepID=UPI0015581B92|nr:DUF2806 domain-containing protein [Mucilaginibacter sp. SG564]NOW97543.1 hypothetical protein [Mucilaginibacter sp. SG564]
MADIQVFGAPITKLIEVVSAAIGVKYKPKAMRNEADAKAYEIEKIAEAEAKASIIRSDAEYEVTERAKQRLYHQEINRQINIDNIVEEASNLLNETVSEQPIDPNWRTRFFTKAQDITSDEMQLLWAKILANEINQPGNFSLRTIDIFSNLSQYEAETFLKLASISTTSGQIFKINGDITNFDISYEDLLLLSAAGLVYHNHELSSTAPPVHVLKHYTNNNELTKEEYGHNFSYRESFIWICKDNQKLNLNCYALTKPGVELLKILDIKDNNDYINSLQSFYLNQGYSVNIVPLQKS